MVFSFWARKNFLEVARALPRQIKKAKRRANPRSNSFACKIAAMSKPVVVEKKQLEHMLRAIGGDGKTKSNGFSVAGFGKVN